MKRHFFLGIGQGERAVKWLETRQPGIRFHAAPDYFRCKTEAEIHQVGTSYVARQLDGVDEYEVYAESQAAPAVVEAIYHEFVRPPRRLVLLQPLGLNVSALGATATQRRAAILSRSREFWRQPSQKLTVAGNRWTMFELAKYSSRHVSHLSRVFLYGSSQDIAGRVCELATRIPVDVYACESDTLFPYSEIGPQLSGSSARLHKLEGTHLNRATPDGLAQLRLTLE